MMTLTVATLVVLLNAVMIPACPAPGPLVIKMV